MTSGQIPTFVYNYRLQFLGTLREGEIASVDRVRLSSCQYKFQRCYLDLQTTSSLSLASGTIPGAVIQFSLPSSGIKDSDLGDGVVGEDQLLRRKIEIS
jgi:hypothetical protein